MVQCASWCNSIQLAMPLSGLFAYPHCHNTRIIFIYVSCSEGTGVSLCGPSYTPTTVMPADAIFLKGGAMELHALTILVQSDQNRYPFHGSNKYDVRLLGRSVVCSSAAGGRRWRCSFLFLPSGDALSRLIALIC